VCFLPRDGRVDRLAWDLGDRSESRFSGRTNRNFGNLIPTEFNHFHPMKGPMVTLTLQDIWTRTAALARRSRWPWQFNATFVALQGRDEELTAARCRSSKISSRIRFPSESISDMDNSLPTALSLSGHVSLGRGKVAAGAALPRPCRLRPPDLQ
jgi:hypothetical protein